MLLHHSLSVRGRTCLWGRSPQLAMQSTLDVVLHKDLQEARTLQCTCRRDVLAVNVPLQEPVPPAAPSASPAPACASFHLNNFPTNQILVQHSQRAS